MVGLSATSVNQQQRKPKCFLPRKARKRKMLKRSARDPKEILRLLRKTVALIRRRKKAPGRHL